MINYQAERTSFAPGECTACLVAINVPVLVNAVFVGAREAHICCMQVCGTPHQMPPSSWGLQHWEHHAECWLQTSGQQLVVLPEALGYVWPMLLMSAPACKHTW